MTLGEAHALIIESAPDVIVLDIMLPDGNGMDFMREIRLTSNIPILLLTGLATPEDIVRGLTEGGDDYLTKPYDFSVLLARVEALMRRAGRFPDVIKKGPLHMNVMVGQATLHGDDLLLTQKDFALLLLFIQNEDRAMRAEYLYEKIWQAPLKGDTQATRSAISRLRKKLGGSGYVISFVHNEGSRFERETDGFM
jgi:DNA-binding response OmpR family regulator